MERLKNIFLNSFNVKKFIIFKICIIFFSCNIALSKEILLECIWKETNDNFWDNPLKADESDEIDFTYYLLSSDFKTMYIKGYRTKAKGECALGNCDIIKKYNNRPSLVLSEEDATYLFYKREWFDKRSLYENRTINKKNLNLIVVDNMTLIEANTFGNSKDAIVVSQSISKCKKINKFPF
tara:strand:+ start:66 stop:608 length:543 start_codon:yes stop_codon:yes gene_type:complete